MTSGLVLLWPQPRYLQQDTKQAEQVTGSLLLFAQLQAARLQFPVPCFPGKLKAVLLGDISRVWWQQ